MTRKLMGDNGAILATYPAIGESGTRPQPALQNMGELAGLYQASIDNPTVDNFLIAGPLFFSFGIPAECMPPTATVIAQLRQAPMKCGPFCATTCPTLRRSTCLWLPPRRSGSSMPRLCSASTADGLFTSRSPNTPRKSGFPAKCDRGLSLGHCTALSAAGP